LKKRRRGKKQKSDLWEAERLLRRHYNEEAAAQQKEGREAEEVPLGGREAIEEALLGAASLTGNLGQLRHRLRPPPPTSCQSHSSRHKHKQVIHSSEDRKRKKREEKRREEKRREV